MGCCYLCRHLEGSFSLILNETLSIFSFYRVSPSFSILLGWTKPSSYIVKRKDVELYMGEKREGRKERRKEKGRKEEREKERERQTKHMVVYLLASSNSVVLPPPVLKHVHIMKDVFPLISWESLGLGA